MPFTIRKKEEGNTRSRSRIGAGPCYIIARQALFVMRIDSAILFLPVVRVPPKLVLPVPGWLQEPPPVREMQGPLLPGRDQVYSPEP